MKATAHNLLGIKALDWLRIRATHRGIRGTTEVGIIEGYVADGAALCSFQSRFYKRYCTISALKPLLTTHNGDVINYFSCVFEVKVSIGDFRKTFKDKTSGRHQAVANLHWCVFGMRRFQYLSLLDELPVFWGALIIAGRGLREIRPPRICLAPALSQDEFAHNLIWPLQASRVYLSKELNYER